MEKWIKSGWLMLLAVVMVVGCSQETGSSGKQNENGEEERKPQKIATTIEEIVEQGAGTYSGDKYDQAKVEAELDKIPQDASDEEVFNTIVSLIAEDYGPVKDAYDNFDPTFNVSGDQPGTEVNGPEEKQHNVTILLDASGSMAARVSGGEKMQVAKEAVRTFTSQLPEGTHVSLIVYGHKGSNSKADQSESCKGIEEIVEMGPYDESTLQSKLDPIRATGWTPLAGAMNQAGQRLKETEGQAENMIYVVSDGLETCGGDPVKEAKSLNQSNIKATVNIIGFDVGNKEHQALKKVAEAGGGKYFSANSKAELDTYFRNEYAKLKLEWMKYEGDVTSQFRSQEDDKREYLRKTHNLYRDRYYKKESNRFDKAITYMNKKGDYPKLRQYNKDRRKVISEKLGARFSESIKKRDLERQKMREKLKSKVSDQLDDLEDKRNTHD
ncbi:VWA domain-containing protein [Kroppenstedtia eburnea]|uniref:vWA domain-containing protein n=1 Tax=Kroppenstedtia eburnea TaxID=714067 RepID=UPI00362D61FD